MAYCLRKLYLFRDNVVVNDEPELEDQVSEPDMAREEELRKAREREEKAKVTKGALCYFSVMSVFDMTRSLYDMTSCNVLFL